MIPCDLYSHFLLSFCVYLCIHVYVLCPSIYLTDAASGDLYVLRGISGSEKGQKEPMQGGLRHMC